MTTPPRSRALNAALLGAVTTAYYAVPDVTTSRAARGWLKTGCLAAAAVVSASLPTSREGWQELRSSWQDLESEDGPDGTAGPDADAGEDGAAGDDGTAGAAGGGTAPTRKAVAVAVGVVTVAASAALTVAAERWVYRRGEARAAAGVRFAHTRGGLVLGALTAALALVEGPPERSLTGARAPL